MVSPVVSGLKLTIHIFSREYVRQFTIPTYDTPGVSSYVQYVGNCQFKHLRIVMQNLGTKAAILCPSE